MAHSKSSQEKKSLHIRNRHRDAYDINALKKLVPDLDAYVVKSKRGGLTVDFSKPQAVKLLNQALLHDAYGVTFWEFPEKNLCPPVPGRADYIHYLADLLAESNAGEIPRGASVTCLDVGVGASAIYPIVGALEYGWSFLGLDIDVDSIAAAQNIVNHHEVLKDLVSFTLQKEKKHIFKNVWPSGVKVTMTLCNPPFHASSTAAEEGTNRKVRNLTKGRGNKEMLNFAGRQNELVCEGGEVQFIKTMITESKIYGEQCLWFTTLVAKSEHLDTLFDYMESQGVYEVITIPMATGNKISRVIAWTFLDEEKREKWFGDILN